MVSKSRASKITFWAWTTSLFVHVVVFCAFGAVKFSQPVFQDTNQAPVVKINKAKKLAASAVLIPKPKIKPPTRRYFAGKSPVIPSVSRSFESTRPSVKNTPVLAGATFQLNEIPTSKTESVAGMEFFGSFTNKRKVCYVVDCSGSMKGLFSRVQKELKDSIAQLQPDQYFYIIFFGDNMLLEFQGDFLVRATSSAKLGGFDFIDSVQPAGQTNAIAALEKAVRIHDKTGDAPSVIYFLTDGFELTTDDTIRFLQKIVNLQRRFAPECAINTIGFWPTEKDRQLLKAIAKKTSGEFVLITD